MTKPMLIKKTSLRKKLGSKKLGSKRRSSNKTSRRKTSRRKTSRRKTSRRNKKSTMNYFGEDVVKYIKNIFIPKELTEEEKVINDYKKFFTIPIFPTADDIYQHIYNYEKIRNPKTKKILTNMLYNKYNSMKIVEQQRKLRKEMYDEQRLYGDTSSATDSQYRYLNSLETFYNILKKEQENNLSTTTKQVD
jgi:hypothetical protein